MKFLSLYIDRYYIVGSVITAETNDNGSLSLCGVNPLRLSNSEDRIWLYFYEDTVVDEITFGLSNKSHCDNRELHYIEGSVFDNIVNKYSTYTLRGISKEMKFIFQDSKIFDVLRNNVEEEKPVVYLSFSKDISISAQYEFVKLLEGNSFEVKQYVAGIDKLVFEQRKRTNRVVLVLSACNENLHLSLYNGDVISEKQLLGKGLDLRQKALATIIVNTINKSSYVLKSEEERESEILRNMPNAESWLKRLDSSKFLIKIDDITFTVDPHTPYSLQLKKSDVENYSQDLIRELTDVIHSFVSSNGVNDYVLQKIIYIGDLFNNQLLKDSIAQTYQCEQESIPISELPSVVSYYTQIDCSEFDDLKFNFKSKAENELRQKHADQDNLAKEQKRKNEIEKVREEAKNSAEKRKAFDNLKRQYKDAARSFSWQDAIDYARKAKQELDIKSLDYSTEISNIDADIEEFQTKLSEQKVKFEIFKKEIKLAREFYNAGLWQDAISHSEKALDYADDVEAKRIITESRLKLDNKDKIKDFVTRATMLLGQKNFEEALEEVVAGLKLETANDELLSLNNEIKLKKKYFEDKVKELADKLDETISKENYDSALEIIAKLIELDNYHSAKWFDKKNDVRELIKDKELFNNNLKILKSDIEFAYKLKQWDKVLSLASDYLSNKEDQEVSKFKREAEIKIDEFKQTNLIVGLYGEIETLITEAKYSMAEKKVKYLQNEYPEERERCKKLLAKIFDLEDEEDRKKRNKNRGSEKSIFDDFFNEKPQKKVNVKKNSSNDDFDF